MASSAQVVVIGGGISGLACALRLQQLGAPVTLLEANDHPGGLIGSVERDGFLFESGPQSFQGTETLLGLIRDLGIEKDLCKADPRAPRFVLRHGRLRKIPMAPQGILTSSLLGVGSRWRIVSEGLGRTAPPDEEESVAQFVRRKFGHEILEYLVSPFVSGVYAGDPEKLSMRAAFPSLEEWEQQYGSVLRGAMKSRPAKGARQGPPPLCSFQHGMGVLTEAMFAKLGANAKSGARVEAMTRAEQGFQIQVTQSGRSEQMNARAVVLATPAYVASHIAAPLSAKAAQILSGIAYAPVAVVAAGYHNRQSPATLSGFGVLIPRSEKYRTLGIVWNSSLFPNRAPQGQMTITSILGGATDSAIIEKSEEEITAIAVHEHSKILRIEGSPIISAIWKYPRALPQYNLGHAHAVREIREVERAIPGLYFAGNYLEGPSIGKCVEQGFHTAGAVRGDLKKLL
ncbi:MAG TPA: protoporphyrinogen oxidase [Verrucomicrobiae bacterium]|nr:protoporphyrinogen oxidase [Verrucomicrobiae bacterium]